MKTKTVTASRALVRYARELAREGIESNDPTHTVHLLPEGAKFIEAAEVLIRNGAVDDARSPINRENLRVYREACAVLAG